MHQLLASKRNACTVTYDADNRIVRAEKNGTTVKVPVGKNIIIVNGQDVLMDTDSFIKDGRIYRPLRSVYSAFGYDIQYHDNSKTAIMKLKERHVN